MKDPILAALEKRAKSGQIEQVKFASIMHEPKRYMIMIEFLPHNGETYELQSMKFKTKPISKIRANQLAVQEAQKCWPSYKISINAV